MGSKARESAKAMSLAFILLDFQHADARKKSVMYETECRHAAVQRGKQDQNHLSTETHTNDFILNTFRNGKPVQFFFQERC